MLCQIYIFWPSLYKALTELMSRYGLSRLVDSPLSGGGGTGDLKELNIDFKMVCELSIATLMFSLIAVTYT